MGSLDLPKAGYLVTFTGDKRYNNKLFRIMASEGFQYKTGNTSGTAEFSTVASGSRTGFKDIKALEPGESPLKAVYAEWGIRDGMEYQLKIQSGSIRLGPDNDINVGEITNDVSPYFDANPTYAFWMVADWFPSIEANNVTPFTATPEVWFQGVKYEIEQIKDVTLIARAKVERRVSVLTLGGIEQGQREGGLLFG